MGIPYYWVAPAYASVKIRGANGQLQELIGNHPRVINFLLKRLVAEHSLSAMTIDDWIRKPLSPLGRKPD